MGKYTTSAPPQVSYSLQAPQFLKFKQYLCPPPSHFLPRASVRWASWDGGRIGRLPLKHRAIPGVQSNARTADCSHCHFAKMWTRFWPCQQAARCVPVDTSSTIAPHTHAHRKRIGIRWSFIADKIQHRRLRRTGFVSFCFFQTCVLQARGHRQIVGMYHMR